MKNKLINDIAEQHGIVHAVYKKYALSDPEYQRVILDAQSLLGVAITSTFLADAEAHGKRLVLHEGVNPSLGYWDAWLSIE